MNESFEMSDTAEVNAANPCCCPEPACLYAEIQTQIRDSDACKTGVLAIQKTDARPGGFDFFSTGILIPLFRKITISKKTAITGSQTQTAKHYTLGAVDETKSRSYSAAYLRTDTIEIIYQYDRTKHAGSNLPLGPCGDEAAIVAVAADGLSVQIGAYGDGFEKVDGQVGVILSWDDNRQEYPPGTRVGSYEVSIDGGFGGNYIDDTSVQIYLLENDSTCHEFTVRHSLGGARNGKWANPISFQRITTNCCAVDTGDQCGAFSAGNLQTDNPTNAGISGTQDGASAANIFCDFLPDPGDAPLSECRIAGSVDGFPVYTDTITPTEVYYTSVGHIRRPTGGLTNMEASDVTATGITRDAGGNITGGTITGGTLVSADATSGALGGGSIVGTLTGGTITGGTVDASGNLTGGRISGGSLSSGGSSAALTDDDVDPDFTGWKITSEAWSSTRTEEGGESTAGIYGAYRLSDDQNQGKNTIDAMFGALLGRVTGYSKTYGWGITLSGDWFSVGGGDARAVGGYPETQGGGFYGLAHMRVRIRECRFRWKVPDEHVGTTYKTKWNIGRFHDRWMTWRAEYYEWAVAKYTFLHKPKPKDPDYPKLADFYNDPSTPVNEARAALKDAIDAINAIPDPGAAPAEPVELRPEIIGKQEIWEWSSDQSEQPDEVIDACDPTKYARELHEPTRPNREDYDSTDSFEDAVEAYETALTDYKAAVAKRKADSKRQSPWYIITPDKWSDWRVKPTPVPDLPKMPPPSAEDMAEYTLAVKRYNFLLARYNHEHHAGLYICNVRHICLESPHGTIENTDHRFPTTKLPSLDPAKEDPARWVDWY